MRKYDIEHYKQVAIDRNGICLSNSYENCRTKLKFKCNVCKCVWEASPRHINEGSWCPECGMQKGRKYDLDHDFFSRDTEESFYWAGFIAADGWVSRSTGAYLVAINLSSKDINHLEKLKKAVRFTGDIKTFKRSRSFKKDEEPIEREYCLLKLSSKKCFNALKRFGIVERKTYKIKFPEWLKNHPMVHHFMRGYIDGDGCFYHKKSKRHNNISFAMRGTAVFLNDFHQIFFKHGISNIDKTVKANEGKYEKVFGKLEYNGNFIISKMYKFLYNDATIYMDRKKDIAEKSLEWVYIGTGKKKRSNYNSLVTAKIKTKEAFLEKAQELNSCKRMAEYYGCSSANIGIIANSLGVYDEYVKLIKKVDKNAVISLYAELKNGAEVARRIGITNSRVHQILKEENERLFESINKNTNGY